MKLAHLLLATVLGGASMGVVMITCQPAGLWMMPGSPEPASSTALWRSREEGPHQQTPKTNAETLGKSNIQIDTSPQAGFLDDEDSRLPCEEFVAGSDRAPHDKVPVAESPHDEKLKWAGSVIQEADAPDDLKVVKQILETIPRSSRAWSESRQLIKEIDKKAGALKAEEDAVIIARTTRSLYPKNSELTKPGYVASLSKEYLNKACTYAVQGDRIAFNKLLQKRLIFSLEENVPVMVTNVELLSGLIKIRFCGATEEVWTVAEATKKWPTTDQGLVELMKTAKK